MDLLKPVMDLVGLLLYPSGTADFVCLYLAVFASCEDPGYMVQTSFRWSTGPVSKICLGVYV